MDFEEVKYRIDTEIEYAKNKIAALKTIEGSGRMRTDLREYTELLGEPQLLQEEMSDLNGSRGSENIGGPWRRR